MDPTRVVRSGAAVLVCVTVLAAAACRPGGSTGQAADPAPTRPGASATPSASASSALAGLSGRQVAGRSLAAMRHLHSVKVRVDIEDRGRRTRATVAAARNGCRIHASMPGLGTVTYMHVGRATVVRLGEKAARAVAGRPGAALLVGRYLKVGDDPAFADLATMCRARAFTKELADESAGVSFTRVGTATVAGATAVVLTVKGSGDRSRLYVAASGSPYLLKAVGHLRDYSGTVTFGDFDRVPPVHLPPARKTIDVTKPHG
ncbi:MAG TPA: hypothetical protein VF053_04730 [Streptosporangiales bacterium]